MPLQIEDDELGRQGFATEPRRAVILTTPTTRTGIQVEQLLPGKVRQLASPKTHPRHRLLVALQRLIEVSDRRQFSLGPLFMQEHIERRKEHMAELRIANVGEQPEGHQHVGPPPEAMPE